MFPIDSHLVCINILPFTHCTVTVEIKARHVKVSGPRGSLERTFKHIDMDLKVISEEANEETETPARNYVKLDLWFAHRKQLASVRTVCSHINNMIVGVTRGFTYKMRFVYSHFPINVSLNGRTIEIRNFLGEKRVRKVPLLEGVDYTRSADVKDQIELAGNDITMVSLTAAKIQQATSIRRKDLRKFLDGIYVSEKGANPEE